MPSTLASDMFFQSGLTSIVVACCATIMRTLGLGAKGHAAKARTLEPACVRARTPERLEPLPNNCK